MFDPALLLDVIAELGHELVPLAKDPRLAEVKTTLTLVDGTLLKALPRLAGSMWKHPRTGNPMHGWREGLRPPPRMHCRFELDRHVPTDVRLTPYRCQGDEPAVLLRSLQPGRCYVMDRGYFSYRPFDRIVAAAGSDYVCRVKQGIAYEVAEPRRLTDEARRAGMVGDVVVRATAPSSPACCCNSGPAGSPTRRCSGWSAFTCAAGPARTTCWRG